MHAVEAVQVHASGRVRRSGRPIVYVCMYVRMYVCMCVCVRERERERDGEGKEKYDHTHNTTQQDIPHTQHASQHYSYAR
jgi:hypothetical protein